MLLPTTCPLCGRPGRVPCVPCAARLQPAGEGPVPALLAFAGPGRQLLVGLKYRNGRAVLAWLGAGLARMAPPWVGVVTWAPTHPDRRRRRGYDQAELVARSVAAALGVPCRGLLRRTDRAGPQTGRSRAERLVAPAFEARRGVRTAVLVVDDVVTTGATLRAAVQALQAAGAPRVAALAAAVTPLPEGARPPRMLVTPTPGR